MALGKSAKVVQPRDDVSSSMLFAMRMSAFQATQSRLDAENPCELDSLISLTNAHFTASEVMSRKG